MSDSQDDPHPVRGYLDRRGIPYQTFAKRLKVSPSYLSLIMGGARRSNLALSLRIQDESRRSVTPRQIADWEARNIVRKLEQDAAE